MMINKLDRSVSIAMKLTRLVLNSHADFLFPFTMRSLKTGMNVTLSAPDTSKKNIKSGIINATV